MTSPAPTERARKRETLLAAVARIRSILEADFVGDSASQRWGQHPRGRAVADPTGG